VTRPALYGVAPGVFVDHGGEVVNSTGDGFFVAFDSASAAIACATAVQRALAEERRTHGFAPAVRIGVHSAVATRRGSDYSGKEVHVAARIAALARGGELFRVNCSACHNFEGAGGALPNGKYAPPLKGLDNKRLYLAMLTGPQQMPVFSDEVLTPEDKRAIIGYLNALHERPADGGLALGGLGPVSEGLWAWIIGLGGLICFAIWIAAKGAKAK
jgi:mono/diheme cytochrome c family protein